MEGGVEGVLEFMGIEGRVTPRGAELHDGPGVSPGDSARLEEPSADVSLARAVALLDPEEPFPENPGRIRDGGVHEFVEGVLGRECESLGGGGPFGGSWNNPRQA